MSEQQARRVVGGVALVMCSVIAAIAWGQAAVLAVIVVGQVWLLWNAPGTPSEPAGATNGADGHTETAGRHRKAQRA